jgi:hypothetical protein
MVMSIIYSAGSSVTEIHEAPPCCGHEVYLQVSVAMALAAISDLSAQVNVHT